QAHEPFGHADRRERDGPRRECEPRVVAEDANRAHHLVVVVKGLTDPHEDDAVDPRPELHDLRDDLLRREVALQARLARGAEAAGDATAHLRRNAGGVAVSATDEDALDGIAIIETEEEFLRARTFLVGERRQARADTSGAFCPATGREAKARHGNDLR